MSTQQPQQAVGVAIITHCAVQHLPRCIPPLLAAACQARVLVVNSSSNDGTVELATKLGAETLVIPRDTFNHGSTRELARRTLGTPVVVFMTPDAYPSEPADLDRLIAPVQQKTAALAYGRQVPRPGAGFFEAFLREINYPNTSHTRTLEDLPRFGSYLTFNSNAWAAYDNAALDAVGGFRDTLSHEDAVAAALLLKAGRRIAYVAEAVVEHSHRYSLAQDFRRYFDAGYARRVHAEALALGGNDLSHGSRYARTLLGRLVRQRPWLLPYAVLHLGAKCLGYALGRRSVGRSPAWCRLFSGQDYYWQAD